MDALAILEKQTIRNAKALERGYITQAAHDKRQGELESLQNYIAELEHTLAAQNQRLQHVDALQQQLAAERTRLQAVYELFTPLAGIFPYNPEMITLENVRQFHAYRPGGSIQDFEQFIDERNTLQILLDQNVDLAQIPNINRYFELFQVVN